MKTKIIVVAVMIVVLVGELSPVCFANTTKQLYLPGQTRLTQEKPDQLAAIVFGRGEKEKL